MEVHLHRSNVVLVVVVVLQIVSLAATDLVTPPASPPVVAEQKVKVDLYYEALCPASEFFIINYLSRIFDNGLIEIVDLKLSPYGNANLDSNGTIVCQHGENECMLNTVEACAIHAWPLVNEHFPFINCVESLSSDDRYEEWETCFKKLNLDPNPVTDCITSGLGHELDLKYADEINTLKPPHTYVPWVVLDGQPLNDSLTDFMSIICKEYKGYSASCL